MYMHHIYHVKQLDRVIYITEASMQHVDACGLLLSGPLLVVEECGHYVAFYIHRPPGSPPSPKACPVCCASSLSQGVQFQAQTTTCGPLLGLGPQHPEQAATVRSRCVFSVNTMYISDLLLQHGATVVKQSEECRWNLTSIVELELFY